MNNLQNLLNCIFEGKERNIGTGNKTRFIENIRFKGDDSLMKDQKKSKREKGFETGNEIQLFEKITNELYLHL
jgi:hypothetical protein